MSKVTRDAWTPDFESITPAADNHAKTWVEAMDWARLETDINTLKSEFLAWAQANLPDNDAHFASLPSWHFMTLGRVALLINNGSVPSADTAAWFNSKVYELLSVRIEQAADAENMEDNVLDAKGKRVLEYVNLYSFIDAVLVKFNGEQAEIDKLITNRLRKVNPNRQQLKKLYMHFKENMSGAINGRDNPEVAKTIDRLVLAVNILAGFSGNAKVAGLSSKVDAKSQRAAAGVTVKTVDVATNLASINPAMIPGATMALIYNTKNRKAMLYAAKVGEKLGIKNTKITGYDETLSFAKTLRKPKPVLQGLRDAVNIKRVRLVLDQYVNGKAHAVNGKISKDMVIVKVFK